MEQWNLFLNRWDKKEENSRVHHGRKWVEYQTILWPRCRIRLSNHEDALGRFSFKVLGH